MKRYVRLDCLDLFLNTEEYSYLNKFMFVPVFRLNVLVFDSLMIP